ncbi:MAG: hypothetical protein ACLR6B_02190 [Blautia sp.]
MERTGLSETDFLDGESCTKEELLKGKAITHFHSCIRRILREEGEEAADAFAEELFRENPGLILVSTELGYGIVPMDPLTGCIGKRSDAFFAVLRNRQTRSVG